MRLAVSADGISFGEPISLLTPQEFDKGINLFSDTFSKLAGGLTLEGAVGGIAGVLDTTKEKLLRSPNLPDWERKPLRTKIKEVVVSELFLENDAALVGLGEAVYGAGKGYKIVAYLTVSTGVGGVRIVNGLIDAFTLGFEPGHQIIDADATICPDCKRVIAQESFPGDLEDHISGAGLKKRFQMEPSQISDPKVWDEAEKLLAYGLNNTIVHWSPEVVVLGGAIILEDRISINKVKNYLSKILEIYPTQPEIKKAELGDKGGLWGALAYLKQIKQL